MFKKSLLTFLASIILTMSILPLFSRPVQAQTWYNQTFEEWSEKVFDDSNPEEIYGERYTYAQVEWVFYSFVAFVVFAGDQEVFSCLLENDGDLTNPECIAAILAAAGNIISSSDNQGEFAKSKNAFLETITTSPVSSVAYFKDVAGRLRLIPEAQAQGFGFGAANPVLGLWRMVRNLTYFLLVVVLIVMAFMIMFRVKISPQTVITVQSALPKVILALILITFSYAIAGFMIDLMYLVIGLLAGILSSSGLVGNTLTGPDYTQWTNMFKALTTERSIFGLLNQFLFTFIIALIASLYTSGIIAALFGILAVILSPLILLITGITLLIVGIRIIWLLLRTFVVILLQIIIGPIFILIGIFSPGGFGLWLRQIAANLAVYPVVGFMFILAFVFLRGAFWQYEGFPGMEEVLDALFPFGITQTLTGSSWTPPLTVGPTQIELLWLGASFVIVLMIPQVANIIKSMIERKPFSYGSAIGQAFGPATWAGRRGGGAAYEEGLYQAGSRAARWSRDLPEGSLRGRALGRIERAAKRRRLIP